MLGLRSASCLVTRCNQPNLHALCSLVESFKSGFATSRGKSQRDRRPPKKDRPNDSFQDDFKGSKKAKKPTLSEEEVKAKANEVLSSLSSSDFIERLRQQRQQQLQERRIPPRSAEFRNKTNIDDDRRKVRQWSLDDAEHDEYVAKNNPYLKEDFKKALAEWGLETSILEQQDEGRIKYVVDEEWKNRFNDANKQMKKITSQNIAMENDDNTRRQDKNTNQETLNNRKKGTLNLYTESKARTDQNAWEIIYGGIEDGYAIVKKPSGLPVENVMERHQEAQSTDDSVNSRLKAIFGDSLNFPYKLDKWASGLQLVALDEENQTHFQNCEIYVRYRMVVQPYPCLVNLPDAEFVLPNMCSMQNSFLKTQMRNKKKGWLKSFMASRKEADIAYPPACDRCSGFIANRSKHPFIVDDNLYTSIPKEEEYNAETQIILQERSKDGKLLLLEAIGSTAHPQQFQAQLADAGLPIFGDVYYNPFFIDYLWSTMNAHPLNKPEYELYKKYKIGNPNQIMLQAYLLEILDRDGVSKIRIELPLPDTWQALFSEK